MTIIEELSLIGIVPVIALDDAKDAAPLAKALINGGINCAEVTFRTAAAEQAIKNITAEYPEMLVGAGTVLTTDQVDRAVAAGAKFIVSPGLNPTVVSYCTGKNIPIVPGTANPSDIEAALSLGLDTVKFFPAEAAGGIKMIKAMSAPYGNIKFMPTGGINADNLKEYLDFDKVFACGGSWMVKKDLVSAGKFDEIERLTREAVNTMLGFSLKHVGINCDNDSDADNVASFFENLFGFGKKVGNSSIFAGTFIEVMKKGGRGDNGHICISTNYPERAKYHLQKQGIEFEEDSASYDAKGKLNVIYLKDRIGGFAVHLGNK